MRGIGSTARRIDPWRAQASRWWSGRSARERTLLALLAAFAIAAGVAILLIRPLQTARAQAIADLRAYDGVQARLLAAGPSPAVPMARRTGDVGAIVAASAPSFGIVVGGVSTAGGTTRLHVAPVGYDALIHWLADLARTSDVRVDRLTLARATAPGTVTGDLVLSR